MNSVIPDYIVLFLPKPFVDHVKAFLALRVALRLLYHAFIQYYELKIYYRKKNLIFAAPNALVHLAKALNS